MTDHQHPITPPPALVQQWLCSDDYPWGPLEQTSITITANRLQNIATAAAQWGADQELEACCKIMEDNKDYVCGGVLRAIRRPKPPSLKEQALADLDSLIADLNNIGMGFKTTNLRRALEALPND
jgi:hypothetical protein